jgi:hypothetical protein
MGTEQTKTGYEQVFTVTDYYDGPRKGIANYHGQPHLYECVFDQAKDDYSELFQLTPVPADVFQLAMEDWNIWRRWETAFHAGQTDISTHPALPHDTHRHAELKRTLESSLVTDPARAILRAGRFEALGESKLPKGIIRQLQVEWTEPSRESRSSEDAR